MYYFLPRKTYLESDSAMKNIVSQESSNLSKMGSYRKCFIPWTPVRDEIYFQYYSLLQNVFANISIGYVTPFPLEYLFKNTCYIKGQ